MSDIPTVAIAMKKAKHGYAIVNKDDVPKGAKVLTDKQLADLMAKAKD